MDEQDLVSAQALPPIAISHPLSSRLDSIGIAGFSHDFKTLEGRHSVVAEVFDAIGHLKPSPITVLAMLFGNTFPFLWRVPTELRRLQIKFNRCIDEIAIPLLEATRREMDGLGEKARRERSVIELLSECF